MKRLIYLGLAFFLCLNPAEAQILKKLKKKILQKTEDSIAENQSQKMWGNQQNTAMFPMGGERVPIEEIPATYDFNWEYRLKLTTEQGSMIMDYYLEQGASYFGIKMSQAGEMFIIYDMAKRLNLMFMESSGRKMLTATRLTSESLNANQEIPEDLQIREIGNKTILGYDCRGYEAESPEYLMKFYITSEPGISFNRFFEGKSQNIPENLKSVWFREKNGIMMEMDFREKKDSGKSGHMICTSLEKTRLKINKSEYTAF